jgi:hypothetical protein
VNEQLIAHHEVGMDDGWIENTFSLSFISKLIIGVHHFLWCENFPECEKWK